jgi:hyperosmotically inducible protein
MSLSPRGLIDRQPPYLAEVRRSDRRVRVIHSETGQTPWDAAIDARNLGATLVAGVVTITGQVSAYAEKREAERLTEMIPGVRAVIVHIDVVIAEAVGDRELAVAVHNSLSWVASLTEHSISARVEGGCMTLSGEVNRAFQRHMAEDAIRNMKGVAAALTRRYDAEDQDVLVSVDNRVVTLSGKVTDWWHRHLTRRAAWNSPGVEDVRDHIRIAD